MCRPGPGGVRQLAFLLLLLLLLNVLLGLLPPGDQATLQRPCPRVLGRPPPCSLLPDWQHLRIF